VCKVRCQMRGEGTQLLELQTLQAPAVPKHPKPRRQSVQLSAMPPTIHPALLASLRRRRYTTAPDPAAEMSRATPEACIAQRPHAARTEASGRTRGCLTPPLQPAVEAGVQTRGGRFSRRGRARHCRGRSPALQHHLVEAVAARYSAAPPPYALHAQRRPAAPAASSS
jgi:hypothetical protein